MDTISEIWSAVSRVRPVVAVLVGIGLATIGWLYTARRQRTVMLKQHTFNALMAATFNRQYQVTLEVCRVYLRDGNFPKLEDEEHAYLRKHAKFLLNHYEFLAAFVRNGDISEKLLKDCERATVVRLFEVADRSGYVGRLRQERKRGSVYEHLQWLYERWEEKPVPWWQKVFEFIVGRPFYHHESRFIALGVAVTFLLLVIPLVIFVHP